MSTSLNERIKKVGVADDITYGGGQTQFSISPLSVQPGRRGAETAKMVVIVEGGGGNAGELQALPVSVA